MVDKVALEQIFSEYFGFPCQFSIHRLIHAHHLSSVAGTIGQRVADVPSEHSLTPPHETIKKFQTIFQMYASSVPKHCLQYRIIFLGDIQLFILILIVIGVNEM
jgi:hypothetical protein